MLSRSFASWMGCLCSSATRLYIPPPSCSAPAWFLLTSIVASSQVKETWRSNKAPSGDFSMSKQVISCPFMSWIKGIGTVRPIDCSNSTHFNFTYSCWGSIDLSVTVYLRLSLILSLTHKHTDTHTPCAVFSCRSRPDCPFRCNLICTPIILFFSGDCCVSRVISQHVHLLSPSNCHVLLPHASHVPVSSVITPTTPHGLASNQGLWFVSVSYSPESLDVGVEPSFSPLCWSDSHWSWVKVFSFPSITDLSTQIPLDPPSGSFAYSVILLLTVNFRQTI